jgi:hypothetical protein
MHMCLSVRGALNWKKPEFKKATKWITRTDGTKYTPDQLREALMDELAKGHEVIPMSENCKNFDYKTGCKCASGEDQKQTERQ